MAWNDSYRAIFVTVGRQGIKRLDCGEGCEFVAPTSSSDLDDKQCIVQCDTKTRDRGWLAVNEAAPPTSVAVCDTPSALVCSALSGCTGTHHQV